ncbi:MAG: aldehyde ferredoxin oxidoreductase family protein [Desulfobacterales bacterium]|nr:aldehyde ferredoxin oxidoreductase family protein [Desulfobacterales bacterium]
MENKKKWYGWAGTLLNIDLTKSEIKKEPLDPEMAVNFIGGDGLGSKLLYDRLTPGTDPLDPGNLFILSTGPLSGTLFPSSGRLSAVFKSPMTGLIGLSNAGGYFGPELKWAGYDAIIISGRAEKPVWIWIDNDNVEIRDAAEMWGKDTWQTIERIEETIDDNTISTVTIGPAGENLVAYGLALVNRSRGLGKGGSGAVMGSKNLKAIAVRGSKGVRIHDPDKFEELNWQIRENLKKAPNYTLWSKFGTMAFYPILDEVQGALPVCNFQEGTFPEGSKALSPDTFIKEIEALPNESCFGCPIQCGHYMRVKSGKYAGTHLEGIEYYAQFVFGPNLGVPDWGFVVKCHEVANRLGLQFSVGHLMSWAAELYQRGILTKEECDGLELTWGNEDVFLELMRKIAYRDGIGDVLACSYEEAANRIGKDSQKYQPIITKLDTSECPRARYDVALSHLISNRGGDHNKALPYFNWMTTPEYVNALLPGTPEKTGDMYSVDGKPELIDYSENVHAILDSLPTCLFASFTMTPDGGGTLEEYAEILSAGTGVRYTKNDLLQVGRRISVMERSFNVREGFDRSLYQMSEKFYETAFPDGAQKGVKADKKIIDKLVDDFLTRKGFDPKTGYPRMDVLKDLGLKNVADQLKKMNRLAGQHEEDNVSM